MAGSVIRFSVEEGRKVIIEGRLKGQQSQITHEYTQQQNNIFFFLVTGCVWLCRFLLLDGFIDFLYPMKTLSAELSLCRFQIPTGMCLKHGVLLTVSGSEKWH